MVVSSLNHFTDLRGFPWTMNSSNLLFYSRGMLVKDTLNNRFKSFIGLINTNFFPGGGGIFKIADEILFIVMFEISECNQTRLKLQTVQFAYVVYDKEFTVVAVCVVFTWRRKLWKCCFAADHDDKLSTFAVQRPIM